MSKMVVDRELLESVYSNWNSSTDVFGPMRKLKAVLDGKQDDQLAQSLRECLDLVERWSYRWDGEGDHPNTIVQRARDLLAQLHPAQTAPEQDELEAVDIAGYRWKTPIPGVMGSGYGWSYASHWSTGPKDAETLMTVTQHERIVAALTRLAQTTPQPERSDKNTFRDAVIDHLVVLHIYEQRHDEDPRQALADLIDLEVAMALDPHISKRAADLRNTVPEPAATQLQELRFIADRYIWLRDQIISTLEEPVSPEEFDATLDEARPEKADGPHQQ